MSTGEARYILAPTAFGAMTEAQALTDTLADNLAVLNQDTANGRPELVEIFSELVNNAAEHGDDGSGSASAIAHVRFIPHRRGEAFDVVVVDEGPGIRETLARNPGLIVPDTDADAILLATQELRYGRPHPGHRTLDDRDGDAQAGPEALDPLVRGTVYHVRRQRVRDPGDRAPAGRGGQVDHPGVSGAALETTLAKHPLTSSR